MILAIEELSAEPTSPEQWARYYDIQSDGIFIQTLAPADIGYPTWVEIEKGAAVRDNMRVGVGEASLVRSKYSGKDFQTYKDQIVAWIALKYGDSFNDFMSSSGSIMLVEYISAALDQMSFYMDRQTDEWYPALARLASSAALLCRYLGYKAAGAVSGSTGLTVTLDEGPYAYDVTLYKGHKVEGPNGLIFEIDSDQVIVAGNTTKDVTLYQGQTFTEVFTSNGKAKQRFNLSLIPTDHFLAVGYTVTKIGGAQWDEAEFLPYADAAEYEIDYLASPPRLRFGDGIIGSIPAIGEEVRVTYIATSGKKSALAIANTIVINITPVVVNFTTIPISVTNAVKVEGGADPESTDSISANAPRWYDAADRVVTKRDMETLAGGFVDTLYGAVAKANALSVRSIEDDLQLQAMMSALIGDTTDMTASLNAVTTETALISSHCGPKTVAGSIQALVQAVTDDTIDPMVAESASINEFVTESTTLSESMDEKIETAKTHLEFLPFREVIAQGDSSTTAFLGVQLAMTPVSIASITVSVIENAPLDESADGDADVTPGKLYSAGIGFGPTIVGRLLRIGGEYRQVIKRESSTVIQYSGPRIYGTDLIIEIYGDTVVGYANGVGLITGTGVDSGSISAEGILNITFTVAPTGLSGLYGVPIVVSYQYESESIKAQLDLAKDDNTALRVAVAACSTSADAQIILGTASSTNLVAIENVANAIIDKTIVIDGHVSDALATPTQMANRIVELEAYLNTIISGECKANIVRISCLVYDSEGFYAAPSISLIKALKTYMDAHRIETVRISVIDGSYFLLKVSMAVQIKIKKQYVFSAVSATVLSKIDIILKGRDGGEGLKRSQYNQSLQDLEGVDYLNVTISEMEWYNSNNDESVPTVDADGNLFIDEHMVITKGVIAATEIY